MKLIIESTSEVVEVVNASGVRCRVWEGATESGIAVQCLIAGVAVAKGSDCAQFDRELQEQREPINTARAFPLRLIL